MFLKSNYPGYQGIWFRKKFSAGKTFCGFGAQSGKRLDVQ